MHMATSPSTRRRSSSTKSAARTLPERRRPKQTPEARSVLVLGARSTETKPLVHAFAAHEVVVTVARSLDDGRALLVSRRWNVVLLDARWEEALGALAAVSADVLRCFVNDVKRVQGERYVPLPLGLADVEAMLETPESSD